MIVLASEFSSHSALEEIVVATGVGVLTGVLVELIPGVVVAV
jgi:hypothetical protein